MENLSEDLLIEIWSRVPCKIAVRSKSISKSFLALISRPEFMERWIHHHHTLLQHVKEEDHEKQWHLNFVSMANFLISFFPTIHQNLLSLGLGLGLSPQVNNPDQVTKENRILFLGCSNGLLLCKQERVYSVCNPVTKHRLQLALPPFTAQNRRDRALEGFLCEPYYRVEGNGNSNSNSNRVTINRDPPRFRVVRIPCFDGTLNEFLYGITKYKFDVVVFSSETGQWSTKVVSCPKGFTQMNPWVPATAHEGKLYFMGKSSLMVYDPFNNEEQCDIIDYPIELYQSGIPFRCRVGVSCGNLRISSLRLTNPARNSPFSARITVWELEQDCGYKWHLVHRTCIPPEEMRDCVRHELGPVRVVDLVATGVQVRGFHPYHGDVVFFQCAHRIFVGNLRTNKFDTVAYGILGSQSLPTISLDLPWWPTPLPAIPT